MSGAPMQSGRPLDAKLVITLGLAAVLLLGVWLQPGTAGPLDALEPATAATAPSGGASQTPPHTPVRVSVLDVLGKIAVAVLLAYGVSFALSRYRARAPQGSSWRSRLQSRETDQLRLRDTLALPRQEGTLYLLEMGGRPLLVGATGQQITVAWPPAAPDDTSAFPPHRPAPEEAVPEVLPDPAVGLPAAPRRTQSPSPPARNQTEWAQERRQLINALMRAE